MDHESTSCTAVILPPTAMSFHRIAGLPLIQRTALSALRSGFDAVVALAPGDGARVRALFARDQRTAAIPVLSDRPLASAVATDRVALIPSDCLVDATALERVRVGVRDGQTVLFQGDAAAGDGGIVLGPRACLAAWDDGGTAAPALGEPPQRAALDRGLCIPIPDPPAAVRAERELLRQLGAATAETDGPIARLDRALSTRLSRLLVRTPLRPNHITTIGTAIGLTGAWCLARGSYAAGLLGTLLFWVAVILDGCDGEVARLTFRESRFGYLFDVTTDNLVHVAIFIGLGVGQYRAAPGAAHGWLVALLLAGFVCATTATYVCLIRHPPVRRLQPRSRRGRLRQWLLQGFEAVMNRDFAYLLVALAVAGRLGWFLWGAAFGTFVYAAALVAVYRWRDVE